MLRIIGMFMFLATMTTVLPAQEAQPGPQSLTVMSFNIRYGTAKDGENHWENRKENVVETVRQVQPDLLGTQETLGFQRDFLAKHLPQYEVHSAGREDGKERGEMCALYFLRDRFEKEAGGHFWLSETPDVPGSKSWDSSLPRLASWVKLRDLRAPQARPIIFLNTHFDHMGAQARYESARLIRNWIQEQADADVIVTGDFNAAEGSAPYVALLGTVDDVESPLVDTYRVHVPEKSNNEGTFSGFKPQQTGGNRIDWIAVSRGLRVLNAEIVRTHFDGRTPSDHFPITAKVAR